MADHENPVPAFEEEEASHVPLASAPEGHAEVEVPTRPLQTKLAVLAIIQLITSFFLVFLGREGLTQMETTALQANNESLRYGCNTDMLLATGVIGGLFSFLPYLASATVSSDITYKKLMAVVVVLQVEVTGLAAASSGVIFFGGVIEIMGCKDTVWSVVGFIVLLIYTIFMIVVCVHVNIARGAYVPDRLRNFSNRLGSADFYKEQAGRARRAASKAKAKVMRSG